MYVSTIAAYSDLHLEHSSVVLSAAADVVVLAGDIYALGPAYIDDPSVIHWIDQTFPNKDVVFVPGNHDLENSYWERQMKVWRAHAQQLGGRIHVLWNESVMLHGIQFLGTPLFSNFSSTNNPQEAIKAAKGVPDFNRIWHLSGKCVTPEDYIQWHTEARNFLKQHLSEPSSVPRVVVTHFAPSVSLGNPKRVPNVLDAYWLNDCDDLVELADLWISGHSHYSCDIVLPRGRMVSNARGVSKLFNLSNDPNFTPHHHITVNAPTLRCKM